MVHSLGYAGDFNAVLSEEDKTNGRPVTHAETKDFSEWLVDMSLTTMRSKGSQYSWTNKSIGDQRILSRIDWSIVNEEWIDKYPQVEAIYVAPSLSDHCPILIECITSVTGKGKSFRFLNFLTKHQDFLNIVKEGWNSSSSGSHMQRV